MSFKKKTKLGSPGNPSTVRLVIDNQEMEDRLKSLKKVMALEKIQRSEATQGGKTYWKSSEIKTNGASNQNNHHALTLKNKVKVLTGSEEYTKRRNKISCGQCDQYKASIACVECIENYCTVCFTKFHQKGALSNHRVRPLNKVQVKECPQTSKPCSSSNTMGVQTDSTPSTTDHHSQQHQVHNETESSNGTLLDGTYDEEASSKSFQDALLAWRNSKNDSKVTAVQLYISTAGTDVPPSTNTCGIQTTSSSSVSPSCVNPSDIHFINPLSSSGLSYMERLMLQRKRSDPSFLKTQHPITSDSNGGYNHTEEEGLHEEIDNGSRLSEHNLFYSKDETVIAEPRPLEYATPTTRNHHHQPLLHSSSSSVVIEEFIATGGDQHDNATTDGGDHGNTITTDHTGDHPVTTNTDDADTITPSSCTMSSNKVANSQYPSSNKMEDGQHPSSEDKQHPSSSKVKDSQRPSSNKMNNKRRPSNKKGGSGRKPHHVAVLKPAIETPDNDFTKPILSDDIKELTAGSYSHAHNKTYNGGLSGFFMMDTPTVVQETEDEDTTDTVLAQQYHQPTTISDTLLRQTTWLHSASIVTDEQQDSEYTDTSVQIENTQPPTALCLTTTELSQEDTDDSDHTDDEVTEELVRYAVVVSDSEDEGGEDDVLEDLSRELVLVSRAEENQRREEYDGDSNNEEITEEALRALSRMTIEQLVQDFEEYQMQVMSNED